MTERGMRQEEQETGRRLRRALTGRRSFTLCFLTYADRKQRDRLSAHFAETLDANELVRLTPQDEPNTPALLKRMAGEPGTPPLQIQDIEQWPEELETLAYRLNLARERFAETCNRPILIWARDEQVTTFVTRSPDLWAWTSGTFDLAADAWR